MLRITVSTNDRVTLKLEGRLVGPWVKELRDAVWQSNGWRKPLEIDVEDLTFTDEDGENALMWLHRMGARFQGKGPFSGYLFERLHIPIVSDQVPSDERGEDFNTEVANKQR